MKTLRERVTDAREEFRSEWGDRDATVELTQWDDRDVQVEVYHTASRRELVGRTVCTRLSTLVDVDGSVEHREYSLLPERRLDEPIVHD